LNPYVALIDELHAVTRGMYDIMETAMSKRDQPLMLSISTAGFDTSSVGHELHAYGKRVLEGASSDDRLFILIYEADSEDIMSERAWEEANPNIDVSVSRSSLRDMAKKASQLSSFRNAFITRHLNRWVNVRDAWLNLNKWDECTTTRSIEDFEGQPCYIGLDLSTRNDITSKVLVFPSFADGVRRYDCFWTNWLPEVAIQESRNASYSGWAIDGHLTQVEGDTIDFANIREAIQEDCQRFQVQEVCIDPWNAAQLAQELGSQGIVVVEVRPTMKNFSPAMKEMEAAVLDKRFGHNGDPAVRWMVGNVTVKPDAAGNVYPAKQKGEQKIDAAVALIASLSRAMTADVVPTDFKVKWF
jgi:phage terminase large subunit-like protein